MIITIDRIEAEFAVCITDDKKQIDIPLSFFENEVFEGNIFDLNLNEMKEEQENRHKRIAQKANRLWAD